MTITITDDKQLNLTFDGCSKIKDKYLNYNIKLYLGLHDVLGDEIALGDHFESVNNCKGNVLIEPVLVYDEGCFMIYCLETHAFEYINYYETCTQLKIKKD